MAYRGYAFKLYPTQTQAGLLAQYAGVCRLVWNLALEQRRDFWRQYRAKTGSFLNYTSQSRELTELRATFDFIREVPQAAVQRTLKDLDTAYQRMWKAGAGFPNVKKKGVRDAFSFAGRDVKVEQLNKRWAAIWVPKLGWVKLRLTRALPADIREVTFVRSVQGWQVSLGCNVPDSQTVKPLAVGIDRGVSLPLALSDGTTYSLPPAIAVLDKRAARAQRTVSRRCKGSCRYAKAQRRVAALRAKQTRVRKHWAHVTTTLIARRYGTVVIECLRTTAMTASAAGTAVAPGKNVAQKRGLNRAILSVGWHQIEWMLSYKADRLVKVNAAYSSQTCSSCGEVDKKSRKSQAVFSCTTCGYHDNADRNAAIVILQRGNTALLDVEGCGCAPYEASTARLATAA